MPKSKIEIERLELNAKMQHILTRNHVVKNNTMPQISIKPQDSDISQPAGEVNFEALYNRSKKAKK